MSHCAYHHFLVLKRMAWDTAGGQGQSNWRQNHELLYNYDPLQKMVFAPSSHIHRHLLSFSWPLLVPGLPLSSSHLRSSLWPSGGQPDIGLGAWGGNPSLGK